MRYFFPGYILPLLVLTCFWVPEIANAESSNEIVKRAKESFPVPQEKSFKSAADTLEIENGITGDSEASFLHSFGVHFGTLGEASNSGFEGLDVTFGLSQRHVLSNALFGEARASLGILKRLDEKVRMIPVEYRLHYRLSGSGGPVSEGSSNLSTYLFAGAGFMHHKPLEVRPPDDPYTRTLEGGLPVTDFWDFESGITPFFPAGIGLELQLDSGTRLDLQLGYHQPAGRLASWGQSYQGGYLGLNAGLRFGSRERSRSPEPGRLPPVLPVQLQPVSQPAVRVPDLPVVPRRKLRPATLRPEDLTSMLVARLAEPVGPYEVMSSRLEGGPLDRLAWIERILKYLEPPAIEVGGHSDSLGSEPVKQLISESRARTAWLEFVDRGLSPERLSYKGYSDTRPRADNRTPQGRALNRRVELKFLENLPISEKPELKSVESVDFTPGEPLYPAHEWKFAWLDFQDEKVARERLRRVLAMLKQHEQLKLNIGSAAFYKGSSEKFLKEIGPARANKIRAWLIERGADPTRVSTFDPQGTTLMEPYQAKIPDKIVQLTFLVPELKQTAQQPVKNSFLLQLGAFSNEKNAQHFRVDHEDILSLKLEVLYDPDLSLYKVVLREDFNREQASVYRKRLLQTGKIKDVYVMKMDSDRIGKLLADESESRN